jgi:hypothetical protein
MDIADGKQMRDISLQIAGGLAVVIALLHAYLGETRVFARIRIEPARTMRLLRLVWQAGAINWLTLGLLLIAAPGLDAAARRLIIASSVVNFGFASFANAWALRFRHFGWAALAIVVGFSLAGI